MASAPQALVGNGFATTPPSTMDCSVRSIWIRRSLSVVGLAFAGWLVSNIGAHSFAAESASNTQQEQASGQSEANTATPHGVVTLLSKPVDTAARTLSPVVSTTADTIGSVTKKPLAAAAKPVAPPASSLVNGLQPTIRKLDKATQPLTVQVGQLVQPVVKAAAPVTQPITSVAAQATAPILGATGSAVSPVLTTVDSPETLAAQEKLANKAANLKKKPLNQLELRPEIRSIISDAAPRAVDSVQQRTTKARADHNSSSHSTTAPNGSLTSPPPSPSTSSVNGGVGSFGASAALPAMWSRHGLEYVAIRRAADRGVTLPQMSDQPGTSPD